MDVFLYPVLEKLGLYTPPDPTYGRYLLTISDREKKLQAEPEVQIRQRRVFVKDGHFLRGEDVELTQEEIDRGKGKKWVYYKEWQKGQGNGADVIVLHGLNAYGGKWAAYISGLLSNGFRVIAPDMPGHGRSTGLHGYIQSHSRLLDALESVILDMDTYSNARRKIFLIGASMGGGIILNFCTLHPGKQRIAGVYILCPMIAVSPETMPNALVRFVGRMTKFFAGRYPFAAVIRGKGSDDPRVEEELLSDPRGYSGKMRIATGFSMLYCMLDFTPSVIASFDLPFRVVHGTHDRVTSYKGSISLFEKSSSKDKDLLLYDGVEHIMLKDVGSERDETTAKVLLDMEEWLMKRV
ncbi:hypothetical protein Clacol_004144 [Clathrus columnatus]|uniref:Serine aminopeptidase S33 domain-containing protein n=1 Tax=Clathrus columnatus TaxID=1419009 RepID=A0AAV5AAI2_9AGAM|nr:hypothetical protein Clacol_004144 [Clathrus columnatus]